MLMVHNNAVVDVSVGLVLQDASAGDVVPDVLVSHRCEEVAVVIASAVPNMEALFSCRGCSG